MVWYGMVQTSSVFPPCLVLRLLACLSELIFPPHNPVCHSVQNKSPWQQGSTMMMMIIIITTLTFDAFPAANQ